jgi:hypothetical protein
MKGWEIFWELTILFSTVSFTYLSLKILIKGWPELKEMFRSLDRESVSEN